MHTIGEDFQFDAAPIYFKNIDKLINYINTRPEYQMEIIYSTPREYLDV
jgi:alpha-mannosidase/alpha-mannosidase II/lysosomal alpha-mannosidase